MTTETIPETTVPLEPTTPIKPSEAIRLGCLIAPVQAFFWYTDTPGSACAAGALRLGLGLPPDAYGSPDGLFAQLWPLRCPACGGRDGFGKVAHLNDDHRWSRERIADWLEGLGL